MPTLADVRQVHADESSNEAATLAVLLDYLEHLEARLARIEAMATSPSARSWEAGASAPRAEPQAT